MKLNIYKVDIDYLDWLRKFDDKISYVNNDDKKRPFIGILINLEKQVYLAPLSSPKPKHIHMKNAMDFMKIDQGKLGVINLNNMIPVLKDKIHIISIRDMEDSEYKVLLGKQYRWCNVNKDRILNQAIKLRNKYINNELHLAIRERCCKFNLLEEKSLEYGIMKAVLDEVAVTKDNYLEDDLEIYK